MITRTLLVLLSLSWLSIPSSACYTIVVGKEASAEGCVLVLPCGRSAHLECPRQEIHYVPDTRPASDPNRSPSGLST